MFQFIVSALLLANVTSPIAQLADVSHAPVHTPSSVYSVRLHNSKLHHTISASSASAQTSSTNPTQTSQPSAPSSTTSSTTVTTSATQTTPALTTPSDTATIFATTSQIVASVPISFSNNAVYFNAEVGNTPIQFQLDTGAYETVISQSYASQLNLPNLGNVTIKGVGGQAQAYNSSITLNLGGVQFANVPCIVDSSYTGAPLFGYNFFDQNDYDLFVSHQTGTMTILNSAN